MSAEEKELRKRVADAGRSRQAAVGDAEQAEQRAKELQAALDTSRAAAAAEVGAVREAEERADAREAEAAGLRSQLEGSKAELEAAKLRLDDVRAPSLPPENRPLAMRPNAPPQGWGMGRLI